MQSLLRNFLAHKNDYVLISTCFKRSYLKEPFSYDEHYYGKFDYHDRNKYPRRMSIVKELDLLQDISKVRNTPVEEPSPFHIVRRVSPMGRSWTTRVCLRRLNMHSVKNVDIVIVPNTPQYNALLLKVKHLIELKPAKFADGRIPDEKDIGALKVCPHTGNVYIDEKLRLNANRLNPGKPPLFQGNHLRYKIGSLYGLSRSSDMS